MDSAERRPSWIWWIVLVTVVAAVASGAVVGFRVLGHSPAAKPGPSPTAASAPATSASSNQDPAPAAGFSVPPLAGAGPSVAYVQTTAGVYRIELTTGRVSLTPAPFQDQDSRLLAGSNWVLSKMRQQPNKGFLIRGNNPAGPLPRGLSISSDTLPGPGDTVWLLPDLGPHNGAHTISLHRLDGSTVTTMRLPSATGLITADQTGQLLESTAGGIYQRTSRSTRRVSSGSLIATGPHHLLTWNCDDQSKCAAQLLNRNTQTTQPVPDTQLLTVLNEDANTYGADNQLNADGTHAFIDANPTPSTAVILDTKSGATHQLPGQLTGTNPSSQSGWTSNGRWLLVLTDRQLRAYDTSTETTHTIDLGQHLPLLHLAVG